MKAQETIALATKATKGYLKALKKGVKLRKSKNEEKKPWSDDTMEEGTDSEEFGENVEEIIHPSSESNLEQPAVNPAESDNKVKELKLKLVQVHAEKFKAQEELAVQKQELENQNEECRKLKETLEKEISNFRAFQTEVIKAEINKKATSVLDVEIEEEAQSKTQSVFCFSQ